MTPLRVFYRFLSTSFGILLFAGVALAEADVATSTLETIDECPLAEGCIDQYLWSLYERTPKIDTISVSEKKDVAVERKGKVRIVTKITAKLVDEDYTWKDRAAAERAGMSLKEYVIGGMDQNFRLTLYHALRRLDDAGLAPGITSAFRDDYRQSIAAGYKAQSDCSYHGGNRQGGYGHALAADIVSVKGKTRSERSTSSVELWKWIDTHEKELGIGRPYLNRDPPHVAPIDGKEYVGHRGQGSYVVCGAEDKEAPPLEPSQRSAHGKRTKMARSSR